VSGNLNPQQFPVYEVGNPEEYDQSRFAPGYTMTNYGREHEVSPEHFGMPVTSRLDTHGKEMTVVPRSEHRYEDVPMESVSVRQGYVYEPHVRNLATIPQKHLQHESDSIDAVRIGNQVVVEHGAHRTTAAKLRGDKTLGVKVTAEYR
jgi:hypothetical protein